MNWIQKLFKRKERPDKIRTMYDFFMYILEMYHVQKAMDGYVMENWNCNLGKKWPSKKLRRKYNIGYQNSNEFVWWLMEQYFEGKLVEKQKGATDEVLPKQ